MTGLFFSVLIRQNFEALSEDRAHIIPREWPQNIVFVNSLLLWSAPPVSHTRPCTHFRLKLAMRHHDMSQKNFVSKFCLKKFSLSVATCNYIRYGRGGGQEIKNAICVLGLNMINDKVKIIVFFPCFMSRQCAKHAKKTMWNLFRSLQSFGSGTAS